MTSFTDVAAIYLLYILRLELLKYFHSEQNIIDISFISFDETTETNCVMCLFSQQSSLESVKIGLLQLLSIKPSRNSHLLLQFRIFTEHW